MGEGKAEVGAHGGSNTLYRTVAAAIKAKDVIFHGECTVDIRTRRSTKANDLPV